jgi:hypothetical protein
VTTPSCSFHETGISPPLDLQPYDGRMAHAEMTSTPTVYRLPSPRSRVFAFRILLGGSIEPRSAGERHDVGGRSGLHLGESGLGAGEVLAVAGVFAGPDTVPKLRVGVAAMLFDEVLEKTHPPPRMCEILR